MKSVKSIAVALIAVLFAVSPALSAEKTVKILAPWQAHGQVFKVAPDKVKVVGMFDGIMYIDNSNGDLDAAVFMCPGSQYIDLETGKTVIEADCVISKGEDKVAYAKLNATGHIGSSKGTFVLKGGEGKWKGISGQGEVVIRTALGDIAVHKKTGTVIDKAAGLAVWPAMKVSLP